MKVKLRAKIYFYFFSSILIVCLIASGVFFAIADHYINEYTSFTLKHGAYAAANVIDVENLYALNKDSYRSPASREIWKKLKDLRMNHSLTYLYVLITNSDGNFVFTYDSDGNPKALSNQGTNEKAMNHDNPMAAMKNKEVSDKQTSFLQVYRKPPPEAFEALKSGKMTVVRRSYTDEFGTFKSAFLPLTNREGAVVALIGADLDISRVAGMEMNILYFSILILIVGLPFAFLITRFLKYTVIIPIQQLNHHAGMIAAGDLNHKISIPSADEIGELAESFNQMNTSLKESFDKIELFNRSLLYQLYTDQLTGLPNRRRLLEDLDKCRNPVIMLFNIDSFQEINDFYGTAMGDLILVEMANRLKSLALGSYHHIYKLYADEYCVVIDEDLNTMGLEIQGIYFSEGVMDHPFVCNGTEIFITISTGIGKAQALSGRNGWEKALAGGEMALKKSKSSRKKYIIYDESFNIPAEYLNNLQWAQKLKDAIKGDRILPYFQPIYDRRIGKVLKYECLARMIDGEGKIISPCDFLNVAKRNRLYRYITKMMIDKSFCAFRENDFEFSINLSLEDMLDEKICNYILEKMDKEKKLARRLVFEMLETENIENYLEVKEFVAAAKLKGCRFAIDDFGTGYSNFSHIIHLNVDYIKIDASIIRNINKDNNAEIIARTVANFAHELGIQTIAEYVHCKEVYEKVRELGIDFAQGYYFGKPENHLL